jgi:hypothetical protein
VFASGPPGAPLLKRNSRLRRGGHSQIFYEGRPLIGLILDNFCRWFACAVSGTSFDADENRRRSSLRGLQHGRELEAVAGEDAIIVIGGRD